MILSQRWLSRRKALAWLWFFGDDADSKSRPRRSERDSAQKKGGGRGGGVCHKPSADERASICVVFLNAWSPVRCRPGIGGFGDRRRIAGGRHQSRRASAEQSWVRHPARNRTDHDRDGEQRALRFAGDRLPVASQ